MRTAILLMVSAATFGSATAAVAQGITISPTLGAFIPASDLRELRDEADQRRLERSSTLGLGLNVEYNWLRASIAYATGAELNEDGIQGDVGDGSVLAVAADLVLRPLPRFVLQPYLLGGAGIKRQDYSYDQSGFDDIFPGDKTDFALHFGAGADIMLGGIGIMAEVSDYISKRGDDTFGQHDAFVMVGLRFRLGGS